MVDKYKKKKKKKISHYPCTQLKLPHVPIKKKKKCPMFYKKREVLYPQQIIDSKGLFGKSI